jgi:hypothetical protein
MYYGIENVRNGNESRGLVWRMSVINFARKRNGIKHIV